MIKAIIYTRGETAKEQIEKCRNFAAEQGYEVIDEVDTLRAAFTNPADFQYLIITEPSRLSRKPVQLLRMISFFDEMGVKIVTVAGAIMPSNPQICADIVKMLESDMA